ncbi:tRNA pseudouridine(55) synthase TruB [Leptolyngbya sp. 15MV]|nr:tRNA pseudouridine(55) synthase TruB [Leptolyngbya sp. 15MV]
MNKAAPPHPISGWLILDKPRGLGSTQAVAAVKRVLREGGYTKTKVGHGGTLDPEAEGVLPIALGEATKLAGRMLDASKVYEFTVRFGEETDTLDAEGEVLATSDHLPTLAEIEAVLPRFTGRIEQVPPVYSALKVDGRRAYDLARAGEEVALAVLIDPDGPVGLADAHLREQRRTGRFQPDQHGHDHHQRCQQQQHRQGHDQVEHPLFQAAAQAQRTAREDQRILATDPADTHRGMEHVVGHDDLARHAAGLHGRDPCLPLPLVAAIEVHDVIVADAFGDLAHLGRIVEVGPQPRLAQIEQVERGRHFERAAIGDQQVVRVAPAHDPAESPGDEQARCDQQDRGEDHRRSERGTRYLPAELGHEGTDDQHQRRADQGTQRADIGFREPPDRRRREARAHDTEVEIGRNGDHQQRNTAGGKPVDVAHLLDQLEAGDQRHAIEERRQPHQRDAQGFAPHGRADLRRSGRLLGGAKRLVHRTAIDRGSAMTVDLAAPTLNTDIPPEPNRTRLK